MGLQCVAELMMRSASILRTSQWIYGSRSGNCMDKDVCVVCSKGKGQAMERSTVTVPKP